MIAFSLNHNGLIAGNGFQYLQNRIYHYPVLILFEELLYKLAKIKIRNEIWDDEERVI